MYMKKLVFLLIGLLLIQNSFAQTQPKISNVRAVIDTAAKAVKIIYDIENNRSTDSIVVQIERRNQPKIAAPTLKGTTRNIKQGRDRVVYWDVVKDNFNTQESVNIYVFLNGTQSLKLRKPVSPSLKWAGAGVCLVSGLSAFYIRNQFVSKRTTLENLLTKIDPDGDKLIAEADFGQWQTTHQNMVDARKPTLFNALVGTAAVAGLFEVYALFLRKHPSAANNALKLQPTSQNLGLGLSYTFK